MVQLLGGVAAELERLTHLRSRSSAPRSGAEAPRTAPPDVRPARAGEPDSLAGATPVGSAREGRAESYRRARQLLAQGHDAWTVREMTGLTLAELDLLASTAGHPPAAKAPVEVQR
jgi:hypothetical protein